MICWFVCLFVLGLNISVSNFSVMLGWSQRFLGINQYCRESMCLAQGQNMVTPVGMERRTSRFGERSTTTPPCSLPINETVYLVQYFFHFKLLFFPLCYRRILVIVTYEFIIFILLYLNLSVFFHVTF